MVNGKKCIGICLLLFVLMIVTACGMPANNKSAETTEQEQGTESKINEQEESEKISENACHIVIDPGHGGFDPGKVSADGVVEKDINLQIALKLKEELENQGVVVTMTRETDMGLYNGSSKSKKSEDMVNRCKLIEEIAPVCTVSIHQNSFPDVAVYGPQVFYYHASAEGKELAGVLQAALNKDLQIEKPRTEKEETAYYILKRSAITTVIVECGFLSNENEAALLVTEEYQSKVAQSICGGLLTWLNGNCYNEVYEYENI